MSFVEKPKPFHRPGAPGAVDRLVTGIRTIGYSREHRQLQKARLAESARYTPTGNPLVSIIIATYNRGQLLVERTLPSLLNQTYPNIEILIVGDHCIDDTPQRMATVTDPRVRFVDLPQRGHYPADPALRWFVQGSVPRNAALSLARGEWLNWISDDDLLLPDAIEQLVRFAQAGNHEFVSAAYEAIKDGKRVLVDVRGESPRIGGMQTWLYRSYLRFFKWNTQSWRKPWNRPVDYDLQDRMFRAGVRMGFLERSVAFIPPVEGTNTTGLDGFLKAEEQAPHAG